MVAKTSKAAEDAKPSGAVEGVTLAAPYGFVDEDGATHFWNTGQVVTDADEVRMLLEREAPLEVGGDVH